MATATAREQWLNRRGVAQRLGVPATAVPALVAKGLIHVRDLPVQARYSAADVERLARESVRQNAG
mgnify:CR=1 FL=1